MSQRMKSVFHICAALVLSAYGQHRAAAQTAPTDQPTLEANKKLVEAFYSTPDQERAGLVSPDLIQHSAPVVKFMQINHIQKAAEAFSAIEEARKKLGIQGAEPRDPRAPKENNFYRIMAEGDLVTIIHERYRADPTAKGKFYPIYVYDTWRVQDGKLVEHWDGQAITQPLPITLREPLSKIFAKPAKSAE